MAITIKVGEEANKKLVTLEINLRKSLSGDLMIFDHGDIDIVLSTSTNKVIAFPKEVISDYVYGNVREVINEEQDHLVKGPNWDKFYLDNIISWWKRKATKRYETLKRDERFRDKVELWTEDDNIQIIR